MQALKRRLRPAPPGPESPWLTASVVVVIAVWILTFAVAAYYFASERIPSSVQTPKYQPGCAGLSRQTITRQMNNLTFLGGQFSCTWQYSATVSDDLCAASTSSELPTLSLKQEAFTVVNYNSYQNSLSTYSGFLGNVSYDNVLTCSTMEVLFVGTANTNVIQSVILGDQICFEDTAVSPPTSSCASRSNPNFASFPAFRLSNTLPIDCHELVDATPYFLCPSEVRLSWFSVLSQSSSIASLIMTAVICVLSLLLRFCDKSLSKVSAPSVTVAESSV